MTISSTLLAAQTDRRRSGVTSPTMMRWKTPRCREAHGRPPLALLFVNYLYKMSVSCWLMCSSSSHRGGGGGRVGSAAEGRLVYEADRRSAATDVPGHRRRRQYQLRRQMVRSKRASDRWRIREVGRCQHQFVPPLYGLLALSRALSATKGRYTLAVNTAVLTASVYRS